MTQILMLMVPDSSCTGGFLVTQNNQQFDLYIFFTSGQIAQLLIDLDLNEADRALGFDCIKNGTYGCEKEMIHIRGEEAETIALALTNYVKEDNNPPQLFGDFLRFHLCPHRPESKGAILGLDDGINACVYIYYSLTQAEAALSEKPGLARWELLLIRKGLRQSLLPADSPLQPTRLTGPVAKKIIDAIVNNRSQAGITQKQIVKSGIPN